MTTFQFTGIIIQEDDNYSVLCPELDVASQGASPEEARAMLLEATTLYLESAVEAGLPYLRPIPPEEDPRQTSPESVVAVFQFKDDFLKFL